MKFINTLLALILISLFASNASMAEGKKLADKLSKSVLTVKIEVESCNADSKKLCPGLALNSQKAFMCLVAYEESLSKDCTLGIVEAAMSLEMGMLAIDHSIKNCEADADKFCLDVKPGEGRIISCLKKNESNIKKQCKTALQDTGFWDQVK